MRPSFVSLLGKKIAYYESKGRGPTILFIHGNSGSSSTFRRQFDSKLAKKYHLLSFDLPGHGKSEWLSSDDQYSFYRFSEFVVEFTKALQLKDFILVGNSLGGHIALQSLNRLQTVKGTLIFMTPPLESPPQLEPAFHAVPIGAKFFTADISKKDAIELGKKCFARTSRIPRSFYSDFLRADPKARGDLPVTLKPPTLLNEVSAIKDRKVPIGIIHGKQEQFVNLEYIKKLNLPQVWKGAIQIIPQSAHYPQIENPRRFNRLLKSFVQELCK